MTFAARLLSPGTKLMVECDPVDEACDQLKDNAPSGLQAIPANIDGRSTGTTLSHSPTDRPEARGNFRQSPLNVMSVRRRFGTHRLDPRCTRIARSCAGAGGSG